MGLIIDPNFTQLIDQISFHASNQGQSFNAKGEIYSLNIITNMKLIISKTL